jgi:hypothetical protein
LSAANTHDSQLLQQLVDAVPAVIGPRGRPGRPHKRPAKLHGDKGYDYPTCRQLLRRRGICPRVARRGVESNTRVGRLRWKVERSLAWLLANRRLTVRYERAAAELELAAQHARVAARRLREQEVPRSGAHAWAAHGHQLAAQELLSQAARLHAARARPE